MDFDAHFESKNLPKSIQTSSNASKIIQRPPKIDFGAPKNRSRGPKTAQDAPKKAPGDAKMAPKLTFGAISSCDCFVIVLFVTM